MASMVVKNPFAFLDGEEEDDDVKVVIERIVKKVEREPEERQLKDAQSGKLERDQDKQEQGRDNGRGVVNGNGKIERVQEQGQDNGRGRFNGNGNVQYSNGPKNGYRRSRSRDLNGNGDVINGSSTGRGGGGGRGQGRRRQRGRGKASNDDTKAQNMNEANGNDEPKAEQNINEANGPNAEHDDGGGWQEIPIKSRGKGSASQEKIFEDVQRGFRSGNSNFGGERRFRRRRDDASYERPKLKENRTEERKVGDEGRKYRNVNFERSGYAGGRGRRRGEYNSTDNGKGSQFGNDNDGNNGAANQINSNIGNEERPYRNASGRTRGRGRGEYRRNDKGEGFPSNGNNVNNVEAENLKGAFGGDAVLVSEVPRDMDSDTSEEVNGKIAEPKWKTERKLTKEEEKMGKERELYRQKRKEEAEKDASLMTLAQYEKMLLERRKPLESQKAEVRKVNIDKDLEGMRIVEKKQDDTYIHIQLTSKEKSEEKPKEMKKDLRNKEKDPKTLAVTEFFAPASYLRGGRGGGRGRGSFKPTYRGGDRDGFRSRVPSNATTGAASSGIPKENDFPVLGA